MRVKYNDGQKEDMAVEELDSLLRVGRVGSLFKDEVTVCTEAESVGLKWQQDHLFVHSSVFDFALDTEQKVEHRVLDYLSKNLL